MFKHLAIAAVGSIALLAGSAAQAVPFTQGSLVISALTSSTAKLSTTTSFALSPAHFELLNGTGDFSPFDVVQSDTALNILNPASFNFSDAVLGSFAASAVQNLSVDPKTGALSWTVVGMYTTGTAFDPGVFTADEAFSLTQVGGVGTHPSISATFFSPEQPNLVPEPMTMSLFGAGLAALGLVRRRK